MKFSILHLLIFTALIGITLSLHFIGEPLFELEHAGPIEKFVMHTITGFLALLVIIGVPVGLWVLTCVIINDLEDHRRRTRRK